MKMQRRTLYAVARINPYPECVVRDILHLHTLKEAKAAWEKLRSEYEEGKSVEHVENVAENVENAALTEESGQDRREEEKKEPLRMSAELADQLRPMSRDEAISYLMERYGKDKKSASIFVSNLLKKYGGKEQDPAPVTVCAETVTMALPVRRLRVSAVELNGETAHYAIRNGVVVVNHAGGDITLPMGAVAALAAELMEIAESFGGGGNG